MGRRQPVCVHTAVFQPGADQPSPLISEFNAIIPIGTASVSLWHLPPLLTLQFHFFEGETQSTLMYLPLAFHFLISLFFFIGPTFDCLAPELLLQLVISILQNPALSGARKLIITTQHVLWLVLYSGQLRLMSVNNSVSQSVDVFLIVDCWADLVTETPLLRFWETDTKNQMFAAVFVVFFAKFNSGVVALSQMSISLCQFGASKRFHYVFSPVLIHPYQLFLALSNTNIIWDMLTNHSLDY